MPAKPSFDVFISHSSKDRLAADAVCAVLEQHRLRCWVAPRNVQPGAEWGAAIMSGIESSRVMVLVFSRHANGSRPVRCEVERALNKNLTIVPFRIEDAVPTEALELFLSGTHWLDAFTPPLQHHLEALARRVAGIVARDVTNLGRAAPPLPQETLRPHAAAAPSKPVDDDPTPPALSADESVAKLSHTPRDGMKSGVASGTPLASKPGIAAPHRERKRLPAVRLALVTTCVLLVVSGFVWHFTTRDRGEDFFAAIARRQAAAESGSTPQWMSAPKRTPSDPVLRPAETVQKTPAPEMLPVKPAQPPALSVPDGYPTIEAALAAAKPGDTVRIKSGAYEEQLRLPDGVSLVAEDSRRVSISIDGKVGSVLDADGCKTGSTIKGIVFSHNGADASSANSAPIVNVIGSTVTFDDCVFEKGLGQGLIVSSAARVTLIKCESRRNGSQGFLIRNATAEFTGCLTESNLLDGLRAFGAGCHVKTSGQTIAKRNGGTGFVAENGARITATQTDSTDNSENGIAVQGADSEATWQDGTIRGNGVNIIGGSPRDSGKGGLGVSVEEGGALFTATGTVIAGNWKHGVVMMTPKTNSALMKCKVQDNHRSGVIIFGAAATALRIEGCEITNSQEEGVVISGAGFRPAIVSTVIAGSTLTGLSVFEMAEPQLEGCTLDKNGQGPMNRAEAGPGMTVK